MRDFYFVYSAIEEEMQRLEDDGFLSAINFKELNRVEAIKKDLRYYYGPNWSTVIKPSEACIRYVERIHEVADSNEPYLLVGHHYTRYLGDLSGGQKLKNIAEKALNLQDGGLAFYEFDEIPDGKEFKIKYRAALDNLPIDESQKDAIIEEANVAFKLNMQMFEEIEGNSLKGFIKLLWGFVKSNINNWRRGE